MKSITSIILSVLLVAASMGFNWGTHYCFGRKVEAKLMLGKGNLGCGMMTFKKNCKKDTNHNKSGISNLPCCENHYQSLSLEDDFNQVTEKPQVNQVNLIAILYTFFHPYIPAKKQKAKYFGHSPPLLEHDFQVLYQTFLI